MVSEQQLDVIITKVLKLTDRLNEDEIQTLIENLQ